MEGFDPFKPVPDDREPGLQEIDIGRDRSGGDDSVPEDDYLGDSHYRRCLRACYPVSSGAISCCGR